MWRRRLMRRVFVSNIPVNDWIAFGFLVWMLTMVGWSVQLAKWGELPNIVPTALMAAVLAFFMARLRFPDANSWFKWGIIVKSLVFLLVGITVIFWQGSLIAEGGNPISRSFDAWDRFRIWIDIAINGGVSADQVPFAVLFMVVTWLLAYITTTLTFRFYNPWIPALVLGLALLTNLSHRIHFHEHTFYLFMLGAVAQFAHLVAVGRINKWRESGLAVPKEARWIAARDGLILGFVVMIVAALMPLKVPRSEVLSVRWNTIFLDPITQFRDTAERLLAGIPSGDDDMIYSPNAVLPFQGGIQLTDEPIMWIRTRYAKLHPSRAYQEYTSQGWITAPSVRIPADAGTKLLNSPADSGIDERQRVDVSVELLGKTDLVIPAAAVHSVDYPAEIEVLEPLKWDVPLVGSPAPLADIPVDLREFVFRLRERLMNMAEESPIYSPPDRGNDRPPFTLNTQPAMTADEVNTAIRQIQSGMFTLAGLGEQITYSITSSSLKELSINDAGEMEYMIFTMSETALSELMDASDETPETVGIRVSSLTLKEHANKSGTKVPDRLMFVISSEDLMKLKQPDLDPLGSQNRTDTTRFKITADDLETMDLVRSDIAWQSFNFRVFADTDGTNANLIRIARRGPTEQNTVTFDEILEDNQRYNVMTYVSTAETSQLEQSTQDYPRWVMDRYLQLPDDLPDEVLELSMQIVKDAGAVTPWEKTMAIKSFLKEQVYSLEIEGPGPRDDGVHYFLFKTINEPCPSDHPDCDSTKRKGYSQYFGSAATVMLRAVGVPARMIAGWSAGEYIPEQGQFLIRDRNRHGWTQIFAPPYGWVDIEVTPGRPAVPRNILVPTIPTTGMPPGLIGSAEFDPDYLQYLDDLDELALIEQDLRRGNRAANFDEIQAPSSIDIPAIPSVVIAGVLILIVTGVVGWRWKLRGQPLPIRAYSQFLRVATLLGYRKPPHVSAREFTNKMGFMTMRHGDARDIIDAFERCVYGPTVKDTVEYGTYTESADQETDQSEIMESIEIEPDLGHAWRSLAYAMLKHRIMTFVGMTPAYSTDEAQVQHRFTT